MSLTPSAIPAIRRLVRSIKLSDAEKLALHVRGLNTPAEVRHYVQTHLSDLGSEFLAAAHFG